MPDTDNTSSQRPTTDSRRTNNDGIVGPSHNGIDISTALKSGRMKVDTDEVAALAKNLELKLYDKDGINAQLNALQSDMDELDKEWIGPNHDRFMEYFTERYERVAAYADWLENYIAAVKQAATIYKELPNTLRGALNV